MGELKRRGYTGDVCLTAEYTDKTPDEVEQLVKQDLKLAKRCFTSV
jgi:hypothetical protein